MKSCDLLNHRQGGLDSTPFGLSHSVRYLSLAVTRYNMLQCIHYIHSYFSTHVYLWARTCPWVTRQSLSLAR